MTSNSPHPLRCQLRADAATRSMMSLVETSRANQALIVAAYNLICGRLVRSRVPIEIRGLRRRCRRSINRLGRNGRRCIVVGIGVVIVADFVLGVVDIIRVVVGIVVVV